MTVQRALPQRILDSVQRMIEAAEADKLGAVYLAVQAVRAALSGDAGTAWNVVDLHVQRAKAAWLAAEDAVRVCLRQVQLDPQLVTLLLELIRHFRDLIICVRHASPSFFR